MGFASTGKKCNWKAFFYSIICKVFLLLCKEGIILEMYLWINLLSLSLFAPLATLYTSCILVGIFINSSVPIFFELFIETVYPVPEGITCGVVTFLSNLFTGLLLFFLTFYFTGTLIFNSLKARFTVKKKQKKQSCHSA